MSDPSNSTRPTSDSWSERFARRYQCAVAPSLADWLDQEIWKIEGVGEYGAPVEIDELLSTAPDPIWPGLMSCDFIPLISNSVGDWLCVRVDQENRASQIVQWYHGGGDWIPWGNDLAEAIVFDALVDRISPDSRRHAIPAEPPRRKLQENEDSVLHWALNHMPQPVVSLFHEDADPQRITETLLDAEIAEVAVHCELMLLALGHPTRESIQAALGEEATRVSLSQLTEWVFDLDRIPTKYRERLDSAMGNAWDCQDWESAARHAKIVSELAPELAWPWEILGYQAERNGDAKQAIAVYRRATRCSVFTDQSVRLNTHWESDHSSKFCVGRLAQLLPDAFRGEAYLRELSEPDPTRRRAAVTTHWMELASHHIREEKIDQAVQCFMAAGWDIGAEPITTFAELLDSISSCAERCGQQARAEVAATHRRCLEQRYGL